MYVGEDRQAKRSLSGQAGVDNAGVSIGRGAAGFNEALPDAALEIGIDQAQGDAEIFGHHPLRDIAISLYGIEDPEGYFYLIFRHRVMAPYALLPLVCGSIIGRS